MGQQQLLLIVVGVIIVGVAVLVGMTYFRSHALENKKNHIISEAMSIGNLAQKYYTTPKEMSGGGRSFKGWEIPKDMLKTDNATYEISTPGENEIEITATSSEVITDTDLLTVKVKVLPKDFEITYTNY